MVQCRAARFVKGRYGMFESVTQMLEQFTWIPLSKRRENSRLILFYKIINNLAMVPHSCLEKADVRTRENHSQKFRHISYNIDPYGQSFFPNCISVWNGLAKDIAEANTLDIYSSRNFELTKLDYDYTSANIFVKESCRLMNQNQNWFQVAVGQDGLMIRYIRDGTNV